MGRNTLTEYCALHNRPELLNEWDQEKNGALTPDTAYPHSRTRVYWRCKEGHSLFVSIRCRVEGLTGCPVCAGKAVQAGDNDLAALYPEIAAQWHPAKNGTLSPRDVRPGTAKKAWWRCGHGHEWRAEIASRVSGKGCPLCGGKIIVAGINDFASQYPNLAAQWHPAKNGVLTPDMITAQSNRIVWWQDELGHEWRAQIASRTRSDGCPICSNKKLLTGFNDLQTRYPQIAKEWDSEKNGITPEKVLPTKRKVWWRCPNGHEYQCQIDTRAYQRNRLPDLRRKDRAGRL